MKTVKNPNDPENPNKRDILIIINCWFEKRFSIWAVN